MIRAIGFVEFTSIARGMEAADAMVKAAQVELLEAKPTCCGKYLVMVCGEVAAVQSATDTGRSIGADAVIDDFVLPNAHPSVIEAIRAVTPAAEIGSLGVIEAFSVASLIVAADTAAKAAAVEILEIRAGTGIGGKSFATLTGDVSAVAAAVETGAASAASKGMLVDKVIIPSPHPSLKQYLC
jgi:microcompartment protein CcmL/EutN